MNKRYAIAVIVLFLVVVCAAPVCLFWQEDAEFSESENRYLAGKPSFSGERLWSGRFMEDTEKYIGDQFPGKEFFLSLRSDVLRLIGNRQINGVYLGEDGYLMEQWSPQDYDEKKLGENTEAVNRFAGRHPELETSVMFVPTAGMILRDKLPGYAPMFDQQIALDYVNEALRGVSCIDICSLFAEHRAEELYYKTDHHWTTYGAFLAYSAWCEQKNLTVNGEDYETETVTECFQGSLHSKVLGSHCAMDRITIYRRKGEPQYRVAYNYGKTVSDSVYDMERLAGKDKYQVFLSGNHPEITITTSQANGKRLLILKDSYANAFIPFLLQDYEAIHVIDPRYYYGTLDEYIQENNINECLFLYNIRNFCEDNDIAGMLG